MKATGKTALAFLIAHSLVPIWVFTRLAQTTDGTERWANTLILYLLDLPLYPIFVWFQDSPKIQESSFINTWISLVLGGLLYAVTGWIIGYWRESRKQKCSNKGVQGTLHKVSGPLTPDVR